MRQCMKILMLLLNIIKFSKDWCLICSFYIERCTLSAQNLTWIKTCFLKGGPNFFGYMYMIGIRHFIVPLTVCCRKDCLWGAYCGLFGHWWNPLLEQVLEACCRSRDGPSPQAGPHHPSLLNGSSCQVCAQNACK